MIDQTLAEGIQVGIDNKDSVAKTLGRPTFTGQFDPNDWYYVSRDTTQLAFRDPRVTASDRPSGPVRPSRQCHRGQQDRQGADRPRSIRRATRPRRLGRKRSFFDELFGNIGTISQPGLPGAQRQ